MKWNEQKKKKIETVFSVNLRHSSPVVQPLLFLLLIFAVFFCLVIYRAFLSNSKLFQRFKGICQRFIYIFTVVVDTQEQRSHQPLIPLVRAFFMENMALLACLSVWIWKWFKIIPWILWTENHYRGQKKMRFCHFLSGQRGWLKAFFCMYFV